MTGSDVMFIANNYTLVAGKSIGDKYEILSFDNALINARVGDYNLVKVSSILPPRCFYLPEIQDLEKGSILHIAYASLTRKGLGKIASAVAVGIPSDKNCNGVIMEYSNSARMAHCIEIAESLVESAMAKRGISMEKVVSIGCETDLSEAAYATTFCGLALW